MKQISVLLTTKCVQITNIYMFYNTISNEWKRINNWSYNMDLCMAVKENSIFLLQCLYFLSMFLFCFSYLFSFFMCVWRVCVCVCSEGILLFVCLFVAILTSVSALKLYIFTTLFSAFLIIFPECHDKQIHAFLHLILMWNEHCSWRIFYELFPVLDKTRM